MVDFPTSPSTGDTALNSELGLVYWFNGASWTTDPSFLSPNPMLNAFRFRTIYTHGYVSGGYKSNSPWRNVNRTVHATDVTTNLGDKFTYAASYRNGSHSDYHHYMYGMTNTHAGTSDYTGTLSMATETEISHTTASNMKTARIDATAFINSTRTITYITAGGAQSTERHNMTTNVMAEIGHTPQNPLGIGNNTSAGSESRNAMSSFYGETKAWISDGAGFDFTWATETYGTNGSLSWATDGQPKGLSSKHGYGYGSTGTYGGSATMYKFNDTTGGTAVSSFTRGHGTNGEENFQIGQDWGYMLGAYNNSIQHNEAEKYSYTTDSAVALGSTSEPKGHDGMSSGGTGSASAPLVGYLW